LEPILPMYCVGTDLEALELLTSIVNHCVLSILIATFSQHLSLLSPAFVIYSDVWLAFSLCHLKLNQVLERLLHKIAYREDLFFINAR
jgi:hypothetical protein